MPPRAAAAPAVPQTRTELWEELHKCAYDTRGLDALLARTIARGAPGVELLLDSIYPEGSPESDRAAIGVMAGQLASGDYETCRRIARRLYDFGPLIRPSLDEVQHGGDPAVNLWLQAVTEGWRYRGGEREGEYLRRCLNDKLVAVRDPASLDAIARRVKAVLVKAPLNGEQAQTASALIVPLARSRDDRYSDLLMPFLRHRDSQAAVLVVCAMGSGRDNEYFPPLLLAALESDRPEVVRAALEWSPNCWDERRKPEIRRLVRRIFDGRIEPLQFLASFVMMHGWQEPDARAYLLEQCRNSNRERALQAIGWIGDACNGTRTADAAVLETLTPFVRSPDAAFRRKAADSLGTYQGEEVVRLLIPLLTDPETIIAAEAARHILDKCDKAMVRRVLQESLEKTPPGTLHDKIAEVLSKAPNQ